MKIILEIKESSFLFNERIAERFKNIKRAKERVREEKRAKNEYGLDFWQYYLKDNLKRMIQEIEAKHINKIKVL